MHKPFHDVLHPPELQGRERHRYWNAVVGWFVLTMGVAGSILFLLSQMIAWIESRQGTEALRPFESWILSGLLLGLVISILLGDYLWGKVFVKSGYLSPAAAIRLRTNRAPTARGERVHRRLSLTLAAMIPLLFSGVAWYLETYWLIAVALVFGAWFVLMIRAGWQQADDMMAGQAPYPEDEAKRVLHDLDPPPPDGEGRP
jgi:hypothetical protein